MTSAAAPPQPSEATSPRAVEVRRARPEDHDAMDAFVRGSDRASFFHRPVWTRAVAAQFRHEDRSLVALEGDVVVGVLPLSLCKGLRGGRNLISVPYGVYGGPAGANAEVERALYGAAERDAVELNVGRLELRCLEDPGLDLPKADLHATFVKELPESVDDVLAGMPKKSRADARKARNKLGLTLEEGRWYAADLVRLFHQNKRTLGSPALPERWFMRLLEDLGDDVTVHVVKREGETLAAVMSFLFRDQVLAYYSGTGPDVDRSFKASSFMYMALQEWSVERGYRIFDFGRSRRGSGAFSFKTHQGFEARDLHYSFRLVGAAGLPTFNPSNPKTEVLQRTWRRLPMGVTR
ncbi:MAG: FemAB family XrtA/PEP-CTERM system-associated protein, partial [Planctomycetota bacterium]